MNNKKINIEKNLKVNSNHLHIEFNAKKKLFTVKKILQYFDQSNFVYKNVWIL